MLRLRDAGAATGVTRLQGPSAGAKLPTLLIAVSPDAGAPSLSGAPGPF